MKNKSIKINMDFLISALNNEQLGLIECSTPSDKFEEELSRVGYSIDYFFEEFSQDPKIKQSNIV